MLAAECDFIQSEAYKNSNFQIDRNDGILYYDGLGGEPGVQPHARKGVHRDSVHQETTRRGQGVGPNGSGFKRLSDDEMSP